MIDGPPYEVSACLSESNQFSCRARHCRGNSRVVETLCGWWRWWWWGASMEAAARRKSFPKSKSEPLWVAEMPTGPQISMWRSWTFWLLLACIFTFTLSLCSQWSSFAFVATTAVTVNLREFSKLPVIKTGELGIRLPGPMPSIYVQDVVLFPDNVMLLVRVSESVNLEGSIDSLECVFGAIPYDSESRTASPVISIKPRTKDVQIVRCRRPEDYGFPSKLHTNVTLGIRDSEFRVESNAYYHPHALPSWDSLVYENLIDADTLVLLAKGLVRRSKKRIDVESLKCVFGTDLPSEVLYETDVSSAAQEVVRCKKPPAHLDAKLRGGRVSIQTSWRGMLPSVTYYDPDNHPRNFVTSFLSQDFRTTADESDVFLEGADIWSGEGEEVVSLGQTTKSEETFLGDLTPKRKLCACTMVWNRAQFIREWVMFHSFMGVEKYFVYDNDSDDKTEEVLNSLSDYNVSRMVWPWIKTQQAAFSHCTILARDQCEWMLFTDVDEYIYPSAYLRNGERDPSDAFVLHRLIDAERAHAKKRGQNLAQIQFDCRNFGPSGLKSTPKQGVTVGYTCRVNTPQRHKSIIMLEALDRSLLNVLHHFELQEGYHNVKLSLKVAVCNHYKYQAWDAFKMKFVRRAGTYTTEWQKNESRGSHDRTPGLGTNAVKPADWESRFCQTLDTRLQEFVLRTFALPGEDRLVWQLDEEPALANVEQPAYNHDEEPALANVEQPAYNHDGTLYDDEEHQ